MITSQVALKVNRYMPSVTSNLYSHDVLEGDSTGQPSIQIRLSVGSSSNNVVRIKPVADYVTGTSSEIDNDAVSQFIKTMIGFEFLKDNWDGYDAVTPMSQTIQDAIKLIKKLPLDVLPTRVGVSNDGEISIIWNKGGLFADFGVMGDGGFCYFINNKKEKLYGDELSLNSVIPDEAIKLLRM